MAFQADLIPVYTFVSWHMLWYNLRTEETYAKAGSFHGAERICHWRPRMRIH